MIDKIVTLQKTIVSEFPDEFDKFFNQAMEELAEFNPTFERRTDRGDFCAYIVYKKRVLKAENVRDEYNLKGIRYVCGDCPFFRQHKDKRIKYTECERGERVYWGKEACLELYEMAKRGEVELEPVYCDDRRAMLRRGYI